MLHRASQRETGKLQKHFMPSFSDLLDLHKQLDELFLEHQRWLIRLDLERAEAALNACSAVLLAHIRDEETSMIPLYGERVMAPVGVRSKYS